MFGRKGKSRKPARRVGWRRVLGWRPSGRALKAGAALAVLVAFGAGGAYLWKAGAIDRVEDFADDLRAGALNASARAGLAIGEVVVEGRERTSARDVLAVLDARRGGPILAFDPHAAKAELETLPWVRRAAVERRLPDTIHVRLEERVPLALWQSRGRFNVIDAEGREIAGVDPAAFARLPVVVGDDAPQHAAALVALLDTEPAMRARVSAAVRVGGRRWNLNLDNGVIVNLPETNAGAAYERLAQLARENGLVERDLVSVDLRLPDRLILRARDASPATPPANSQQRRANRPT
ncbi:MAG: FtsQ-type POTRA domain-containing protein [Azospirillum sp.]|nr:FtsQ-type POTRA domain-containing protein [Azospirillum sp.]